MRPFTRLVYSLLLTLLVATGCKNNEEKRVLFDMSEEDAAHAAQLEFQRMDPSVRIRDEWLKPSKQAYKLGVGDQIEIEILEVNGSLSSTFVMPDGRVYYDLAGGVKADGLTVRELGARLTEALANDYAAPKVNVTLREVRSRRVWVLGRVGRPGLYPLSQPTTILEAIAMAGGLFTSRMSGSTEELADLRNSFVLRKGEMLPVDFLALLKRGDMSQNIYLKDGDYVYLPSALSQSVNVLGAVRQPQAVGFKDQITLIAALARAKGPLPSAQLDRVHVIRDAMTEPRVAIVNARDIMSGNAKNVELRSHDIVWIPERPTQKLRDYFWVIMNAAATSVAVREGANSVEGADGGSRTVIPFQSTTP